jgi:colanic acid/amylovoran biosynthesis glycosyltransferase
MSIIDKPVVAVWRSLWLPASETFIRNQLQSMDRWRPYKFGLYRQGPKSLVDADYAPYSGSLTSRASLKLNSGLGMRFGYDRALSLSNATLMHAHFGPDAIQVLPIARRLGLPLVVTFHGYDVTSQPAKNDSHGLRYRDDLLRLFTYASRLIAVSDFIATKLADLGAPEEKIEVQPIGVPIVDHLLIDDSRQGIVFVGRLVEKKGVIDLIEALARLPEHLISETPICLVGDGPLRGVLRLAAEKRGLTVSFLGTQDSDSIARILARSQIFVAPSKTAANGDAEGFGMVFLEASLQELPIVAYRHGGVNESVVDGVTGILGPEGDIKFLAQTILHLLESPQIGISLGRAGRARTIEMFNVKERTADLERLYDSVIESTY